MAERSRSKQKVRSSRIKDSPRIQYSPKGRRRNVYLDAEDIHFSENLVKTFGDEEQVRRPRSEELETYVKRSESEETSVRYVTRNSYQDKQPIVYVMKEQVADEKALPEYVMQRPSTRNVRCQVKTHYVIQPQPKQRKPLSNEHHISCVTKKQAENEKAFRRQEYIHFPQEYVSQSPETRNVCCQMTTHYVILSHSKQRRHNEQTQTQPEVVVPPPDIPSSRTSTSSTLPPSRDKSPENIKVIITNDFKLLYPKSPKKGIQKYIDSSPTIYTPEQLTETSGSPSESLEPEPFDDGEDNIVPKTEKKIDDDIVTVGGGWNTMDNYMERHDPVQGFVYIRNSDLPENRKKYYGFKSIYKYPQYKSAYRFYKSKCFFSKY
ncbi:uncharacterized protein LOC127724243 [Mytilus californianus]|uniref:uncharacterized protein LOC127724243 n=1 Tax=Mytilus californianus TaxID=6549 RepID=UPI0022460D98|nr:uncharacterized protein LOC127724243 [Mytilus californianus]